MADHTIPFKCGRDGTEWLATLGTVGPKLGFVSFSNAEMRVEPPPQDRKAQVMQRFSELLNSLNAKAPLPPPQQVEIVEKEVAQSLTSGQITAFGFSCPSCRNTQPLLCPSCQKYSCQGAQRDSAGRIQCQWCGEALILVTKAAGENVPNISIETTTKDLKLRTRELPSPDHTKPKKSR